MRQARAGHDTCGQRVTPRCRWAAGPGRTTSRRAERSSRRGRLTGGSPPTGTHSDQAPQVWRAPEGPEGTGGLRDNAPRHTPACQSPPMWRASEGPEGLAAVPVGGGGDWPAPHSTEGATGVEGAGGTRGPDCGARGRWRGLAGLRDDAPSRRLAARTARGRATAHGNNQQPGPAGRAKRPARQHTTRRHKKHSTGARAHRPAPLDATTQTRQLRSTCVPYRSARAARQWRRSSRSPRLRRRAGPRR